MIYVYNCAALDQFNWNSKNISDALCISSKRWMTIHAFNVKILAFDVIFVYANYIDADFWRFCFFFLNGLFIDTRNVSILFFKSWIQRHCQSRHTLFLLSFVNMDLWNGYANWIFKMLIFASIYLCKFVKQKIFAFQFLLCFFFFLPKFQHDSCIGAYNLLIYNSKIMVYCFWYHTVLV